MRENDEPYYFTVEPSGQKEALDILFNGSTKGFIQKSGIKPGMKVLDIGCGTGIMSCWLAEQVGSTGKVVAIDNNIHTLMAAKVRATDKKLDNLQFHLLSAYDISTLKEHFDLVYCRFVLHHLNKPTSVIQQIYEILKPGGIYIAEEGIVSSAFTYPASEAWGFLRWNHRAPIPLDDLEGQQRDSNFGMKLFYKIMHNGFTVKEAGLIQPFLFKKEDKALLSDEMLENKEAFVKSGGTLASWEDKFKELNNLIDNEMHAIAFYQSCQVAGTKPIFHPEIETTHLQLKCLEISDANAISELFSDETKINPKESLRLIEKMLMNSSIHYQRYSTGFYGVYLKATHEFIGLAGFDFRKIADHSETLLFIRLCEKYKYTEALLLEIGTLLRDYAFKHLKLLRFVAPLEGADPVLVSVLKKIGMHFEGKKMFAGESKEVYAINRIEEHLNKDEAPKRRGPEYRFFPPGYRDPEDRFDDKG